MVRPLSQVMQPTVPRVSEDRRNASPPAENRVRTGAAVYRSHSLRSYFRPPEPLTRQPSLADGRSHETSRKPISYTLDGDELEAVLKKGLEAVKRRQMPIQPERATAKPPQSAPLGQRPLHQLASPSYMHAAPPCRNLNAERRPEVRHASHHYAPQLLQSQCAEFYVLR
ncbi:hypothetical protein MNAN1_001952 [Malassezia nana]|uniref:Uncharacterized protein n=1 Tax=Malassezia nana TaxID=180528 RepID=A0AAF0J3L2_9BASI|nr:hypothetical protein MNAN1_001952 [Malassezia nana]